MFPWTQPGDTLTTVAVPVAEVERLTAPGTRARLAARSRKYPTRSESACERAASSVMGAGVGGGISESAHALAATSAATSAIPGTPTPALDVRDCGESRCIAR